MVPVRTDAWEDLVATGRASRSEDAADIVDEAPGDYGIAASQALAAMRANER